MLNNLHTREPPKLHVIYLALIYRSAYCYKGYGFTSVSMPEHVTQAHFYVMFVYCSAEAQWVLLPPAGFPLS